MLVGEFLTVVEGPSQRLAHISIKAQSASPKPFPGSSWLPKSEMQKIHPIIRVMLFASTSFWLSSESDAAFLSRVLLHLLWSSVAGHTTASNFWPASCWFQSRRHAAVSAYKEEQGYAPGSEAKSL